MPRGDLHEPAGKGHGTKRGVDSGGTGKKQARGSSAQETARLRQIVFLCRSCGYTVPEEGSPHSQMKCPNCGGAMTRQ
jgi:rubrerythrin